MQLVLCRISVVVTSKLTLTTLKQRGWAPADRETASNFRRGIKSELPILSRSSFFEGNYKLQSTSNFAVLYTTREQNFAICFTICSLLSLLMPREAVIKVRFCWAKFLEMVYGELPSHLIIPTNPLSFPLKRRCERNRIERKVSQRLPRKLSQ